MIKRIRYVAGCLALIMVTFALSGAGADDGVWSADNQLRWVKAKITESRAISARVQNLLKVATAEMETIKITCLEDKMTQIKASLRGVEERAAYLKFAHDAGKRTEANQHFSIIKIYISKISGLSAEADNCMGENDIVLGKTKTIVEIDGDINVDPSEEDGDESVDELDPSELDHASGYY